MKKKKHPKRKVHARKLHLDLRAEVRAVDGTHTWKGYAGPVMLGYVSARTKGAGMRQLRALARKQLGA
jgi:hypothetical protein